MDARAQQQERPQPSDETSRAVEIEEIEAEWATLHCESDGEETG